MEETAAAASAEDIACLKDEYILQQKLIKKDQLRRLRVIYTHYSYNYSYRPIDLATRVFDGFQQTDFDLAHTGVRLQ